MAKNPAPNLAKAFGNALKNSGGVQPGMPTSMRVARAANPYFAPMHDSGFGRSNHPIIPSGRSVGGKG